MYLCSTYVVHVHECLNGNVGNLKIVCGYLHIYIQYVTGSAKTLHSHTSDFTTLTSHNFKSTNDIASKCLDVIEQ